MISNNCFSGNALKDLFERLLPGNKLEFIMASSDYIFNKPHSMMFEIALKKAGLTADKVWYCGDSIRADVYGAKSVGMFPVLYEGEAEERNPFADQNDELTVDFEYLHIHDWREMMEILDRLQD